MVFRRALSIAVVTVIAVLAAVALAIARNDGAVSTTVGSVELTANGRVAPGVLSKRDSAPITLEVESTVQTTDDSHPPAASEIQIEIGRNATINVKGYPMCKLGLVQSSTTAAAEAACTTALIGTGRTAVQVAFPEQNPFNVQSKLLVFNGGERGGGVTLYVHAYFGAPISGAIVIPVVIKKINHGPYGLVATVTVPRIADGAGSMTAFDLKVGKRFTHEGKKQSILNFDCPNETIPVRVTGRFANGTKAPVELPLTCRT